MLSFKGRSSFERVNFCSGSNQEVTKVISLCKPDRKDGGVLIHVYSEYLSNIIDNIWVSASSANQ